jgi:hypothetical protein
MRRTNVIVAILLLTWVAAKAEPFPVSGRVVDPQGMPVAGATLQLFDADGAVVRQGTTDDQGCFTLTNIEPGQYHLNAQSAPFTNVSISLVVGAPPQQEVELKFRQIAFAKQEVNVVASAPTPLTSDPSQNVVVHDQVLDANPGRPGAPISIPGLPTESASGGIKAPQYFAPGVAGDHGEPIAQFFQVGNFLLPNNLPANAHGNGYADPNYLIAPTIAGVSVDAGAFNVLEGNNSVDLSASYLPQTRIARFLQVNGDYRDGDVIAGWSPQNPQTNAWLAAEASFGDGFLQRPEHRQQYKLNGSRTFVLGKHELTLFGIGYYGFSYIPGLIPLTVPVPGDTIDSRQLERTNTFIAAASDTWKLDERRQFFFSGFFRNYALTLRSNFGDGLIQQSETRNIGGGEAMYSQTIRPWISFLAGADFRRDVPSNLDLKHIDDQGNFQPVTSNNLALSFLEPFIALNGVLGRYVQYSVGVRQEEVWMDNQDLINPQNSFNRHAPLTLPKGSIALRPSERWFLPAVAFSYGEAFHTEDPRIGNGTGIPTLLLPSRAYQLLISKTVKQTRLSVTLRQISNSQDLAKIDPDTGLQQIVGPSRNRVLAVSLQRNFSRGNIFVSYAQADARDVLTGQPVPEAPRFIWDTVGTWNRLPMHLQFRGEVEYVRAKPLGDGFTGVPVTEFRGAVMKQFMENRTSVAANFLVAHGYTGQTTETLALPNQGQPFEQVVGVPLKSYVSLSWTYYFKK